MRIIVKENQIKVIKENKEEYFIEIGYKEISDAGTIVVDQIVEHMVNDIDMNENVSVIGQDNIEMNMIARKLEDKIKREVQKVHPMEGVEW